MKIENRPLLISNPLLDEVPVDIFISDGIIQKIEPHGFQFPSGDFQVVEAAGLSVFPGLHNMHSHSPMVLFRGLGDDQPLDRWLKDYIWPAEQGLDDEKVYLGTRQACREMLASGTTYFNDMYFHLPAMARAVEESGIRARLGLNVFGDAEELETDEVQQLLSGGSRHVAYSIAPHSVYTVTEQGLVRSAKTCADLHLPMHIHMSETPKEVSDCLHKYGCRPWELLDRLGVLDMLEDHIIAAHCLHLSEHEIELIGRHHITCVHCPNSNLKLGSGYRFPLLELLAAGAHVALGTDGAASSNNLDMIEAMKTAALLQKGWRGDPTSVPAAMAMEIASEGGRIASGRRADLFLAPVRNLSDLVYATHGESVQMTVVDGQIVYKKNG